MSVIASVVSAPKPLPGQNNRSSQNFQLVSNDGNQITAGCPGGIVFNIMKDVSWGTDPVVVEDATNETVIPGGKLDTGTNYYIANPKNASSNFNVTLSQS